jgi:hypothetical protein
MACAFHRVMSRLEDPEQRLVNTPLSRIWASFIEQWPPGLRALSFPTAEIRLDEDDLLALISQTPEARPLIGVERRHPFSNRLQEAMSVALGQFSEGAFLRTGASSFKRDGPLLLPLRGIEQARKLLMFPNPRVARLAVLCRHHHKPVSLFIRQWQEIPHDQELRLFFAGRCLIAATPLHPEAIPSGWAAPPKVVVQQLREAEGMIAPHLPLGEMVVDVVLNPKQSVTVIETNPFGPISSAGLFQWPELAGQPRVLRLLVEGSIEEFSIPG